MYINRKEPSPKTHSRQFVSGVLVLSCSTVLVKIIGLVYKIPMLSLLGAEGMGYFNSAYEIYALFCIIATVGLPSAVSILVSRANVNNKNDDAVYNVFKSAMRISLFVGVLGTAILFLFSEEISLLVGNSVASSCVMAIAPSLLFVCVSGAYRGYFQGKNCMYPTAISQIIEVVGKLIFGLTLAYMALKSGHDVPTTAAYATAGLSLAMFCSAFYLVLQKKIKERKTIISKVLKNSYVGEVAKIAIPITLSSLVMGITKIIDMTLILRRLQGIGFELSAANRMYGAYTTLAVPVFSLIPSLIAPISLALVPGLSAAIERNNKCEQSEIGSNAMRLTIILALPSSLGIVAFSKQILNLLFLSEKDNVAFAAPLLSVLGASVFFSCIITTTNAILHSYKKTLRPIIAMFFGAFIKLISGYFLIGDKFIGILGAPISTLLCDSVVAIINLISVIKYIPELKNTISALWRSFVSAAISILAALAMYFLIIYKFNAEFFGFLSAVITAVIFYFVFIFITKALTIKDIENLPMGEKISVFIKKSGIKKGGGENDY